MQSAQELLQSEFSKRKERNPNFSLRSFAKWLGISPAQLSQMMTGKRAITLKLMKKISDRLGLSPSEKKAVFTSMLKNKDFLFEADEKQLLKIQEDKFRLIADWYHLAILSLTKLPGAQSDPRWIARRLGLSFEQAHQALLRLERVGVIQMKPKFQQLGEPFEVVSDTPSEAIRKYHKQNLNLAIEKIDTVTNTLRQYQSLSIPVDPKQIESFKKLIDDFLKQASDLSDKNKGKEIYHLNVQLFPVTTIEEKKS